MVETKKESLRILILYTELASYTLACIDELAKRDTEIKIVRWPINKEAPFDFKFPESVEVIDRDKIDVDGLLSLSLNFKPDVCYVSGWIDKAYLEVAKRLRKSIPVIVGFDNQWTGSLKQRIAGLLAFKKIKPYFSHAWVPGEPQMRFAKSLGFKPKNILTGVYSADTKLFGDFYKNGIEQKKQSYPHKLLYVGRYVEWKGIEELWEAFKSSKELRGDWELVCIGTGEMFDSRPDIEGVKHVGFVQPNELEKYIHEAGAFILPSKFEPWGVVLHEYAAAGLPIISSSKVGAASDYLEDGKNGWKIDSVTADNISKALHKLYSADDNTLRAMGERSRELSQSNSPVNWAETLLNIGRDVRN